MTTKSTELAKTILLVEDEGIVLLTMQMALEEFGYQVVTAIDGDDAWQQYTIYKDEIDLVVTDMFMPGMDGMALLAKLRARSPDLKVILMTGHLLDTDSLSPDIHKPTRYIAKPIRLSELIDVVEATLT